MDSDGYNEYLKNVNDINKEDNCFPAHEINVRASCIDECKNAARKQQNGLLNDDVYSHSQNHRFHNGSVKRYVADEQSIKIKMEDKQLDDEAYNDGKCPSLSPTDNFGKGELSSYTCDKTSNDLKFLSLSPTDSFGKEQLSNHNCDETSNDCKYSSLPPTVNFREGQQSRHSYENKQKRNTILFPYSNMQREEMVNLSRSAPSLINSVGHHAHKSDITSTPLYKEIYANNIRQYSFLLAKKLGTSNQSPQELRKVYLHNRKKAAARGVNASIQQKQITLPNKSSQSSLKDRSNEQWKYDSDSLSDTSSVHSEGTLTDRRKSNSYKGKHKGSLTDISNILCQCDHKALISEPSNTADTMGHSRMCNVPTIKKCDLSYDSIVDDNCNAEVDTKGGNEAYTHNTESVGLDKRQNEADKRQRLRVARLKSFDNMVSNANTLMKDLKLRKSFSKSMDELC